MARKERERDIDQSPWTRPGFVLAGVVVVLALALWAVPGHRRGRAPRHRVLLLRPANNGRAHDPFIYRSLDVTYKEQTRRLQRPARASSCASGGTCGHHLAALAWRSTSVVGERRAGQRARGRRGLLRSLAPGRSVGGCPASLPCRLLAAVVGRSGRDDRAQRRSAGTDPPGAGVNSHAGHGVPVRADTWEPNPADRGLLRSSPTTARRL